MIKNGGFLMFAKIVSVAGAALALAWSPAAHAQVISHRDAGSHMAMRTALAM